MGVGDGGHGLYVYCIQATSIQYAAMKPLVQPFDVDSILIREQYRFLFNLINIPCLFHEYPSFPVFPHHGINLQLLRREYVQKNVHTYL